MSGPLLARRLAVMTLVALALACRSREARVGVEAPPRAAVDEGRAEGEAELAGEDAAAVELPPVSEDPVIRAIVELAAADSQVDDHARALAVEIGPRLTGSAGLSTAERWAVRELEGWGLEARRDKWGELAVGFERGPAHGAMVRPERRELEFGTHAWTPGTKDLVRGQALLYPQSDAELRWAKPYLRGAWVVVPYGKGRPGGKLQKRVEAALERAGIAGLVLPAGGPEDELIHTHGRPPTSWSERGERVEIRLRGDQHAEIEALLADKEFVQLEFSVDNHFVKGPAPQHNVIADLLGEEQPEEFVIVGGHLDSWDGAGGAVDNATGVATAMEAARLIAAACEKTGERPDRSIRVMLWTGEEQGLLGSRAWVDQNEEALDDISAVLVHDGGTNYLSGLPVTPEQYALMAEVFAPVEILEQRRRALHGDDPDFEAMPFALRVVDSLILEPSDSTPFIRADVPGFYWDQAGRSDYERYHHTQFDEFEAIIDDYQRRSALVVAIAAWGLAEADEKVSRVNAGPLEPRRLGVELDDNEITAVVDESVAAAAGLELGDRVVEIDGAKVEDAGDLVEALQVGEARKTLVVERGEERLEIEADWSDEPAEQERARRRRERIDKFGPEIFDVGKREVGGDGSEQ